MFFGCKSRHTVGVIEINYGNNLNYNNYCYVPMINYKPIIPVYLTCPITQTERGFVLMNSLFWHALIFVFSINN